MTGNIQTEDHFVNLYKPRRPFDVSAELVLRAPRFRHLTVFLPDELRFELRDEHQAEAEAGPRDLRTDT